MPRLPVREDMASNQTLRNHYLQNYTILALIEANYFILISPSQKKHMLRNRDVYFLFVFRFKKIASIKRKINIICIII